MFSHFVVPAHRTRMPLSHSLLFVQYMRETYQLNVWSDLILTFHFSNETKYNCKCTFDGIHNSLRQIHIRINWTRQYNALPIYEYCLSIRYEWNVCKLYLCESVSVLATCLLLLSIVPLHPKRIHLNKRNEKRKKNESDLHRFQLFLSFFLSSVLFNFFVPFHI